MFCRSALEGILTAQQQQSPDSTLLKLTALTRSLQGETAASVKAVTDTVDLIQVRL